MGIIEKLASSIGRRDEVPNQDLAKAIALKKDKVSVKELAGLLGHKNKDIQSDSIKVMDEIGKIAPELVVDYIPTLVNLLQNKNNRLQWGAMCALDAVTNEDPKAIYTHLSKIISAADKGSVITNDHCVGILIKLCANKNYAKDAFSLLNERLLTCPTNQLPMYAENALSIIHEKNKAIFIKSLQSRLNDFKKETKRKRVEKIIIKLSK